jgi:hypothetical protein
VPPIGPDEYHILGLRNVILVGEMRDLGAGFARTGRPICAYWKADLRDLEQQFTAPAPNPRAPGRAHKI